MPFGGGSRACIGYRMALLEARLAVALLHRRFAFELSEAAHAPGRPLKLDNGLTLSPAGGIWVRPVLRLA
jgi:cytochrome P450